MQFLFLMYYFCYRFLVGDLEDEDEVLAWLNDDDTLQIPGRIEEVNVKMLEKLLDENENVVVFFCESFSFICSDLSFSSLSQ